MIRREQIAHVAKLQGELLRQHRVGHPEWYAEMLVCAAVDGQLALTNNRKFDLHCAEYGTVQVKSRVHGTDTTQNRVNFKRYISGDFDHAAIVIFEPDFRIKDAVMLPQTNALKLMRAAGHVKWLDARNHSRAVHIRPLLVAVSGEEG